jgi:hypothetical protein
VLDLTEEPGEHAEVASGHPDQSGNDFRRDGFLGKRDADRGPALLEQFLNLNCVELAELMYKPYARVELRKAVDARLSIPGLPTRTMPAVSSSNDHISATALFRASYRSIVSNTSAASWRRGRMAMPNNLSRARRIHWLAGVVLAMSFIGVGGYVDFAAARAVCGSSGTAVRSELRRWKLNVGVAHFAELFRTWVLSGSAQANKTPPLLVNAYWRPSSS